MRWLPLPLYSNSVGNSFHRKLLLQEKAQVETDSMQAKEYLHKILEQHFPLPEQRETTVYQQQFEELRRLMVEHQ